MFHSYVSYESTILAIKHLAMKYYYTHMMFHNKNCGEGAMKMLMFHMMLVDIEMHCNLL